MKIEFSDGAGETFAEFVDRMKGYVVGVWEGGSLWDPVELVDGYAAAARMLGDEVHSLYNHIVVRDYDEETGTATGPKYVLEADGIIVY